MNENIEQKLGFDRIRQLVVEQTSNELAARMAEEMAFETDYERLGHELRLVEEMRQIVLMESEFPQQDFIDLTPVLTHLHVGNTFIPLEAMFELKLSLRTIRECYQFLAQPESPYPTLAAMAVEVELGSLAGKEDDIVSEDNGKTNPAQVPVFVEGTGCDTLAVAIGNVHGLGMTPQIDIPLLEQIRQVSRVPLVLHGGSGIPKEVIWECKKHNLVKINYGSDLRREFIRTFGEAYEKNHGEFDLFHLSMKAVDAVAKKACELVTMINEH